MSVRTWYDKHAFWVACVVTYFVLVPSVWWLASRVEYETAYENYAASQAQQDGGYENYRQCFALAKPQEALDCLKIQLEPKREEQRAEEDLRAQKDMANWALGLLVISFAIGGITIGITGYGVFLVRDTLAENRIAAGAAVDAAKAASRQADISEESFKRLERPYLFVRLDRTSTRMLKVRYVPPGIPFMTFKLVNFGKMPAVLNSISVRLELKPELPLRLPMGIKRDVYEVVEPMAETSEMPRVYVEDGRPGEPVDAEFPYLLFHGSYSYEDPTGAVHTDRFCMRGEKGGSFVLEGGSEYNWRKTEYPKAQGNA